MSERLKDGDNLDDQDDTTKKRIFTFLGIIKPTMQSIQVFIYNAQTLKIVSS